MGSGGSRSLLPPGKLFEVHGAGVAAGPERLQSGAVFRSDACRVQHRMMDHSISISQAIKLLEVIWSSLTGN